MCVIHDHRERLIALYTFEPTRYMGERGNPFGDRLRLTATRVGCTRCHQDVIDIHFADQGRKHRNRILWCHQIKSGATRGDVNFLAVEISLGQAVSKDLGTTLLADF